MADLRLKGTPLRIARSLAEFSWSRAALWKLVSADFRVAELSALDPAFLGHVEEVPAPIQGAPPRSWGNGDSYPRHEGKRTSGAMLRDAFASKQTTPLAVLNQLLSAIDDKAFGKSTHNPLVAIDRSGALAAARASTERWSRGEPLGPMDGLVVVIKDEFHQKGLPNRGGTSWRNTPSTEDAFIVARLREQGAILLGKSHVTENGMNPLGFNAHHLMPRNVYSDHHGAGGSSTGTAVAVALGFSPASIGTDGGGSIRLPAAMNGIFGLKPTFNRLSGTGDIWRGTVGHAGPLGQTVADMVDLLIATAARDPKCPLTHFATDWDTVRPTWKNALGRGIKGCRIGVLRSEFKDASPPIRDACNAALHRLESDGAILVDVQIDKLFLANAIGPVVIASESASNASTDLHDHLYETGEELRLAYALMNQVSGQLFLRASRARTALRHRLANAIADVDVLALPTFARQASPYPLSEDKAEVSDTAWTGSMTRFSFLANLTGLPSVQCPVGMNNGLSVGIQFIGDAWDEASCIAVAAHVERLGISDLPLPDGYLSCLNPA